MRRLWAPWRMRYLEREPGADRCFLCDAGAAAVDGLVLWRGRRVFGLLNAFPYVSGHAMIAPYAHESDLLALDEAAAVELMHGARLLIRAIQDVYRPDGYNIGANLGAAAGAGHADHLHLHIVPRWRGDTNFMTTTGHTRVIPEALEASADRLRRAIRQS